MKMKNSKLVVGFAIGAAAMGIYGYSMLTVRNGHSETYGLREKSRLCFLLMI
jgi:hypothetical protein